VKASGCSTDADCPVIAGDLKQKCDTVTRTCKSPCITDRDCPTTVGTTITMASSVCSNGYCEDVGCSADDQCFYEDSVVSGKVREFCLAKPTTAATPTLGWTSAITY